MNRAAVSMDVPGSLGYVNLLGTGPGISPYFLVIFFSFPFLSVVVQSPSVSAIVKTHFFSSYILYSYCPAFSARGIQERLHLRSMVLASGP